MLSVFKQCKFYLSYAQDAGLPMTCHLVIEAPDEQYAKRNWVELVRQQGYVCHPMGDPPYQYDQLFEVPNWMDDVSILKEFGNG